MAPLTEEKFPILQDILSRRVGGGALEFKDVYTRCGCQFVELTTEMELALKQYLRNLQMAQGI